jgi:formate dehydrogenase iron-sulfur subunit
MQLNRREFMKTVTKTVGTGIGVTLLGSALRPKKAVAASQSAKAILYDMTICRGCRGCEVLCRRYYDLPRIDDEDDTTNGNIPKLQPNMYTEVKKLDCSNSEGDARYIKWQCMHCVEPTCTTVCPTSALYKTDSGPVKYDISRCIGCQYCVSACPFSIPHYDWETGKGITKCSMCADRLSEGEQPVCVANCPLGALRIGDRSSIITDATKMQNEGKYVYGIDEYGGTSWIYVSDIPFDKIGFPSPEEESYPNISRAMFGSQTATIVVGAAAVGLYSLFLRKKKMGEGDDKK